MPEMKRLHSPEFKLKAVIEVLKEKKEQSNLQVSVVVPFVVLGNTLPDKRHLLDSLSRRQNLTI